MTRALVVLGAVRALIDLANALDELAHRFGVDPLGAHGQMGEWDLDADVNLSRFALGVMWERDGDRDPLAPTTTVLAAHLGPVTLSASRQRPATWRLPVTPADCAITAPFTAGEDLVALELDDPCDGCTCTTTCVRYPDPDGFDAYPDLAAGGGVS